MGVPLGRQYFAIRQEIAEENVEIRDVPMDIHNRYSISEEDPPQPVQGSNRPPIYESYKPEIANAPPPTYDNAVWGAPPPTYDNAFAGAPPGYNGPNHQPTAPPAYGV